MSRTLAALVAVTLAFSAQAIEFKRYHSQDEINAYLREVAKAQPSLVVFDKLGQSDKGRELSYVVITKALRADAPVLYLNGTHHGNEKSSTETILGVIDHLTRNQNDPVVADLLSRYRIFLQPMVNADGHAANTREDAFGRDPNRDYAYPGKDDSDAFHISFIRLVKELVDKMNVRAAIAYHSGMEAVLWPWCASKSPTAIKDTFHTLSKIAAEAMGFRNYKQSYYDYPSYGEFIDYLFQKQGTLAVTFEVSSAGNPPASQLERVVERAVKGTMAYLKAVADLDAGRLALVPAPRETGDFNPRFRALGRKVE